MNPKSIGKAVAIQGLVTSIATLFSIGVIFGCTKHLDFQVAPLIVIPIFFVMSTLSVAGLKEMEQSQATVNGSLSSSNGGESNEKISDQFQYFTKAYGLQLRLLKEISSRDNIYNVCYAGMFVSEMGYLLSFVFINAWISQFFVG